VENLDYTQLERFGFTDPASGKGRLKKVRARQAIVVIASDWLQRIFVLYTWAGRIPTSRYLDKIIKVCDDYQPKRFGIEANAMQSLFADLVTDAAKKRMKRLSFIPVMQPTRIDKDFRIRTVLEPVVADGRLFMMEKQVELEGEIRSFPTGLTKDLVDCLASAITLVPRRPLPQQQSEEAEQLASYLRNTGAPSWYIQKRVKEVMIDAEQSALGRS
jgi:hypothetical protein